MRVDGSAVQVPTSSQRVVAFLVVHRRPLARMFVAGHLWADAGERRAAAALRTALWRLGDCASQVVRCDSQQLSIDPRVEIDVDLAARAARTVLDDVGGPVPAAALALLCEDADLLVDWYDDWVIFERERLRQLRLHALEALCERLSAEGRHAAAAEAGLAAVRGEPLRESAHRALVRAYLHEGNACEALRQYRLCRELLRRELGQEPSERLERLVAHLPRMTATQVR